MVIKAKNKLAFVLVLACTLVILGFASACHCGDGSINQISEQCDDGNLIDYDGCSSTCQIESACNLQLTKSTNKNNVKPGDIVTYTLHYKNIGGSVCTGTGVEIQDTLDENLLYNGVHTENIVNDIDSQGILYAGYSEFSRALTWNAHAVSPNEEGTITFDVTVLQPESCGDFNIDNFFRTWSNQEKWKDSNTVSISVDNDCPPPEPSCGDGQCNGQENCTTCSSDCGVCPPPEECPSCGGCVICNTNCGNGVLDSGEECDDGNLKNFDGCSKLCYLEEENEEKSTTSTNHFVDSCKSNWVCSAWSECVDGTMTRECVDENYCADEYNNNKPYEQTSCTKEVLSKVYIEGNNAKNVNFLWIILGIILFVILLIIFISLLKNI
jgi:uncharacterized repeat protein (TIGR01451 family)